MEKSQKTENGGYFAVEAEQLTQSQRGLLEEILAHSPVSIDQVSDRIDDVRRLIARGQITLKIVQCPWGIDFQLVPTLLVGRP